MKKKMKISIKIENLIRNPCSNFLSYLYAENGWKRSMLNMAKECYVESLIYNHKSRIQIIENGTILLTCSCIFDVLICMEFIIHQFESARMYYLVWDKETRIIYDFTYDLIFETNYDYEKHIIEEENGMIVINNNIATLTFKNYEDGYDLINTARELFQENKNDESLYESCEDENMNVTNVTEDTNVTDLCDTNLSEDATNKKDIESPIFSDSDDVDDLKDTDDDCCDVGYLERNIFHEMMITSIGVWAASKFIECL